MIIVPEKILESQINPLLFWDKKNNFYPFDIEEICARGLNFWQGWSCSAGLSGIYVDFNGDVYRASCKAGPSLGNVYHSFELAQDWIVCPIKRCVCGADMMLAKVKDPQNKLQKLNPQKKIKITSPEIVTGSDSWDLSFPVKRIVWNMGRRCNYSCSYCHPSVHSSTEKLKSYEQLEKGFNLIHEKFCKEKPAKFYIAGGEPTLYPGFLELIRLMDQKGHQVSVVSNGSRKADYYQELIKYSHVTLSYHFHSARFEHFYKVVREMIQILLWNQLSWNPNYYWVDIKLMVPPGGIDSAVQVARKIYNLIGFPRFGGIRFQPLWEPFESSKLYPYSPEETTFFIQHNSKESVRKLLKSYRLNLKEMRELNIYYSVLLLAVMVYRFPRWFSDKTKIFYGSHYLPIYWAVFARIQQTYYTIRSVYYRVRSFYHLMCAFGWKFVSFASYSYWFLNSVCSGIIWYFWTDLQLGKPYCYLRNVWTTYFFRKGETGWKQ